MNIIRRQFGLPRAALYKERIVFICDTMQINPTLAVGVCRRHYESASMMLQAQADGCYDVQSDMEKEITRRVNEANIDALGLHGEVSVLATFMKVGPRRASRVRIVCVRPTCFFEPRIATIELKMED